MKPKSIFGAMLFLCCFSVSSQNSVRNLLFNSMTDVVKADFSGGSPVISYTGISGGFGVAEGIAHQENALGNIIFWVTSNGVNDIGGTLMPGSVGLIATSSSTEINIAPFPNNPNRYYILYNNEECSNLYYSVVDMTLRGGLGDVINLNTLLDGGSFGEGMELVRIPCSPNLYYLAFGCNGVGIKRFLIDNTGIHPGVVIYPLAHPTGYDGRGEFDFHNGRIGIAFAYSTTVFTANFDASTGLISNPILLVNAGFNPDIYGGPYGLEFSPDATKMYISIWYTNLGMNLWQYDFSTASLTSYALTNPSSFANGFGQIEMGKDGKLYIVNDEGSQITVITNPNANVPSFSTIPLNSNTSLGISDFIQSDVYNTGQISVTPSATTLCLGNSVTLTAAGDTGYIWTPTAGLSSTTGATVVATPTITTVYTVSSVNGTGCTGSATATVSVTTSITPTFTALGPYCVGATPALLPTTSTNGIVGAWNPNTISTAAAGTLTYTFTPTAGQCAVPTNMTITVGTSVTPTFSQVSPICSGAALSALPTSSNNIPAITGTWSPPLNNTATTTYTFTPTLGQCASTANMTITVNPSITPLFTAVAPICTVDVLAPLPTSSNNTPPIMGTWSPALNNTATTTYTFSPTLGVCATTQTLTISVTQLITPNFPLIPPFCFGAVAPTLPTTSPNGIVGTWNPATINNTTSGTYTFTQNPGQCATGTTLNVTVDTIPIVTAAASPSSICNGQTSLLNGSGAATYFWTPVNLSGTSVNVTPSTTTTYTVVGSTAGGCTNSAMVVVDLISVPPLSVVALPLQGCTPLTAQFNYAYTGTLDTTTLHWDFGDPSNAADVSNASSPSYTYANAGDYNITLSGITDVGCITDGNVSIHVFPSPIADFYADPTITNLDFSTIHFYDESFDASQWMWSFGDPHSNLSFEQFPEHTYDAPGNYAVLLVVHNGECNDSITKYVLVRDAFTFYIPNTFTPTGDFLNDNFNGKGMGFKTDEFQFFIYDRWGEKIFYTTDPEKGWDGKVQGKGEICQGGAYIYKFNVVELNGIAHKYVGIVLLVR